MKIKYFSLVGCILILCACSVPAVTPAVESTSTYVPTPVPTSTITPLPILLTEAQQYLSDAFDIIQENAYYNSNVDWENLRPKLLMAANGAKSPADTYPIIIYVLGELDHHSYLMTPDDVENMSNVKASDALGTSGKVVEEKLGYITVFGFSIIDDREVNKYADQIQTILIDLNEQGVCGWIIDLRYDHGGSPGPHFAGLGTLIGEGLLMSLKDRKGQLVDLFYQNGQFLWGDMSWVNVSHPEFRLDPNEEPVAVLIGPQTVSEGEFLAILFRGRPNTRFFGKPSQGLTTYPAGFMLSDGAVIKLTTSIAVDRTGQEYGGSILPDVTTSSPEEDAAKWLLEQPACTQ